MARFNTTRWSLIADACGDPVQARPALESLCRDYRPPVLAYVRRHAYFAPDAEDLTQEFFARFLEKGWYAGAAPERGRFRALVLTALRRFLLDAEARVRTQKRGGRDPHVELTGQESSASDDTPERAFMRSWLGVILDRARRRLHAECVEAGKGTQFERLWGCMDGRADGDELATLADALGVRRNTVAVQLHRLRARMRQLTRLELQATVGSAADLELELGELRAALGFEPSETA
jgi:RNA polymerase sigma factor (sigma-70 family)